MLLQLNCVASLNSTLWPFKLAELKSANPAWQNLSQSASMSRSVLSCIPCKRFCSSSFRL